MELFGRTKNSTKSKWLCQDHLQRLNVRFFNNAISYKKSIPLKIPNTNRSATNGFYRLKLGRTAHNLNFLARITRNFFNSLKLEYKA